MTSDNHRYFLDEELRIWVLYSEVDVLRYFEDPEFLQRVKENLVSPMTFN